MGAIRNRMRHQTNQWHLDTPDTLPTPGDPRVVMATIHPRGDQRILKCVQSLLNQRVRVHMVWLGEPSPHETFDSWLRETVLPKALSTKGRLRSTIDVIRHADTADADILYAHDYYMLPHALWWKSRSPRRRVVFDSHEFYPELYAEKFPRFMQSAAKAALRSASRLVFSKVDALSLVSADMIKPSLAFELPVIITPNYPSSSLFPRRSEPADATRIRRAIHTGSLSREYGAEVLIRACAIIDEAGHDISIDALERFSSSSDREWFKNELKRHGSPSCLRMIPSRPAGDMQSLLGEYGIGLALLQRGGQSEMLVPTKLYEYSTSGLAVVATDLHTQQQFIKESPGVTGVSFRADDPEALVRALLEVQKMPTIYSDLEQSTVHARNSFSWDRTCDPQFAMFRTI